MPSVPVPRIESKKAAAPRRAPRAVAAPKSTPTPWPKNDYPPIETGEPSFEPAAMQRLLDGDQAEMRNKVRDLLSRPEFAYYEGSDKEGQREQTLAWAKLIAKAGISGLFFPKSVGGGEDVPKFMAAFETLATHDLSLVIKFGVQFGLWGGAVMRLGTDFHHQKYLPDTIALKLAGCFAMTELGHGSNVKDVETVAVYDPKTETFDLHSPTWSAGKTYIGNAATHGRIAAVYAQLETRGERHGVHAFVVPLRDAKGRLLPGIRIEDNGQKLGLNGVDNGRIWFDHVSVPRTELLNRYADVAPDGTYSSSIKNPAARFFTALGTLVGGRVSVGQSGNSAAKSGLAIAIRYAARRRQFGAAEGQPETLLLDYPTHQRRLLPLLANVYALDFAFKALVKKVVASGGEGRDFRKVETLAAAMKAFSTWNATHALQTCRECCGGEGYIAANRFAALKADSDIFTTFEGDNTVLMQLAAKNLLTDFKEWFRDMSTMQMATWTLGREAKMLAARNPLSARRTDADHLRDPEAQLDLFRLREEQMLTSAGKKLRDLTADKKTDVFTAFLMVQNKLVRVGQAFVERVILEEFNKAVKACPDASLRPALERLRSLYALSQLEKGRAWFLEEGIFSANKSRAISREVNRLCAEVRKEAVALVDGFGIPPALLAAPIAL